MVGVHAHPLFITFTIISKVAVYAPSEWADTLTPVSSLVKICILCGCAWLTLRIYTRLEDAQKRGLKSKRGQRYTFAPKAGQMSLKWESFAGESFKFKYGYNIKVLDTHTVYWLHVLKATGHLQTGGHKEMSFIWAVYLIVPSYMQGVGGGGGGCGVSANEYSCAHGDLTPYLTYAFKYSVQYCFLLITVFL